MVPFLFKAWLECMRERETYKCANVVLVFDLSCWSVAITRAALICRVGLCCSLDLFWTDM